MDTIRTALSSVWPGHNRSMKPVTLEPRLEPGPLRRAADTGGCRLPKFDAIIEAYNEAINNGNPDKRHIVDASLSAKLAGDLARPFGQSTGRGFSFTDFRIHTGYQTLVMRQQDAFAPYTGPNGTASLRTLYELGRLVTHADPICEHLHWSEEYPFLVPNLASIRLDQRFSEGETRRIIAFSLPITALDSGLAPLHLAEKTANIHPQLRCLLFHKANCSCRDGTTFGLVRSCPRCFTDYAVSRVPDPASGRLKGQLLVFTTWKSLGHGSYTTHWMTHQTSASPKRTYGQGYMLYFFEGDGSSKTTYKIDVAEIQQRIASVREPTAVAPPEYADVVDPGSKMGKS
ncbi:hypothetical protein QBC39DRAFT_61462 [Podospora conica]|nr:hypothetical protein QBC39DRAFT_61462 [Schizothecium conicum]